MLKWCVFDNCGMDEYIEAFEDLDSAMNHAEYQWSMLTGNDKKRRDSFFVGLANVEKCPDGWTFGELPNGDIDTDIHEIKRELK